MSSTEKYRKLAAMPIPTPRLGPTAAALLLALAACAPSAPRPEQARPVPTVVPPPTTAPAASAAPIPSVTPDAGPTEVPLLPTPFHIIAQVPYGRFRMHASGEHLLVMGEKLQAELDGDTLVRSARLGRGLPKHPYDVWRIAGDFPDPLVVQLFDSRPDVREPTTTYLYRKTGWQRANKWPLIALGCTWHGPEGQVAIFTGAAFGLWSGPPRAKLPHTPPSTNDEPKNPLALSPPLDERCLPDGHVFTISEGPDREPEPLRLAIWKPDGELPSIVPMPLVPRCDRNNFCHVNSAWLDAKGPRDVWLFGIAPAEPSHRDKPFLAHFEGASWTQLEVPPAGDDWNPEHMNWLAPFAVGDDGTVWIIRMVLEDTLQELWRRSPDGTWARIAMPSVPDGKDDVMFPEAVLVRGKDDVWVTASERNHPIRWFILRTKPQPMVTLASAAVEVKP